MSSWCRCRFTARFPCRVPLVGASMAGVSGGRLAAETCRAGALGFIAAGHFTDQGKVAQLEEQIRIFRDEAPVDAPLCIGFIGYSTFQDDEGWQCYEDVLKKHRPAVVQFFAPAIHVKNGKSNVQMAHEHQAKVLGQVGNVAEGIQAIAAGVDGIIAQGSEAGGHGIRRELGNGTFTLASRLIKIAAEASQTPIVLAAGGIADGRGVAAALALGCDGAVLGTRLWASNEALNKASLKHQLTLAKSCDDVHRTRVFDQIKNKNSSVPWPAPYDSVGALRNKTSEYWDGRVSDLDLELLNEGSTLLSDFESASEQGDPSIAQVLAGEGVGEIEAVEPAYEIISRIESETREAIHNLRNIL